MFKGGHGLVGLLQLDNRNLLTGIRKIILKFNKTFQKSKK